ncbi:uncharacterized protein CCR75_000632 [Bremia lactucae]|uniref:Uncharacterized protein n=1 Tax=Bremia lactucae TaxID=4779 RepID=A0A976FDS7_BRELC|nr:hypothetical protein CCR75_000632 [Bremia lactucae]
MAPMSSDGEGFGCAMRASTYERSTACIAKRLRESMEKTTRLLDAFEHEVGESSVPMGTYQRCCRQLILYMDMHMETSANFLKDMEAFIEPSYRNRPQSELEKLVANQLWAQYNGRVVEAAHVEVSTTPSTPRSYERVIKTDEVVDGSIIVTPVAVANAIVSGVTQSCSPHVDLTVVPPSILGSNNKRQLSKERFVPCKSKRARHTVARNLYGAGILNCDEKEDSESDSITGSGTDAETDVTASDLQLHFELNKCSGEVLWPCAGERSFVQNVAYKRRLKAAIQLIDAKNCSPPISMMCTQECANLRTRMCLMHRIQRGSAKPCHDQFCCVWLEIDTHLVRCQNSQCEFKNMVGLRQTKYDIQQYALKLEGLRKKLLTIEKQDCSNSTDACSRSKRELEMKIEKLKGKCAELEDTILLHRDRERAFMSDLDILKRPSVLDSVPSFQNHYA